MFSEAGHDTLTPVPSKGTPILKILLVFLLVFMSIISYIYIDPKLCATFSIRGAKPWNSNIENGLEPHIVLKLE